MRTNHWSMELLYKLFIEYQKLYQLSMEEFSTIEGKIEVIGNLGENVAINERKFDRTGDELNSDSINKSLSLTRYNSSDVTCLPKIDFLLPYNNEVVPPEVSIDNRLIQFHNFKNYGPKHPLFNQQFNVKTFPRNILRFKPFEFSNFQMVLVCNAAKILGISSILVDLDQYEFSAENIDLFQIGKWKFDRK